MSTILILVGVGLLLLVFVDALWTVLWVDGGAGPLTSRLGDWGWRLCLAAGGRKHPRLRSLYAPAHLAQTYITWVLLLWAGWTLVLAGDPDAILNRAGPNDPPDWAGRIWFAGYTISTLGNGDFSPNGDTWQVVISLMAFSGLSLTTLTLSYVTSVVSSVTQKRAFANQVMGMGQSPQEILKNGWNGRDLHALDQWLNSTSTQLDSVTERYLAYPVLKYYHAADASKSPAVAAAVLDEALTLLRYGVTEDVQPNLALLHSARSAVQTYLGTLESIFIDPNGTAPSSPDRQVLQEAGIPIASDGDFAAAIRSQEDRRRRLLAFVRKDGWTWPEK